MPARLRMFLAILITAIFVLPSNAQAADIKVLSDSPLAPALKRIADAFYRDSGHEVQLEFGLSPAIHRKLSEGEAGDVVVIQPNFIGDLVDAGKIVAGSYPAIARVGIGLFTRTDADAPDVSTVTSFKQALLDADTLAFSNVAAGNYFATVLERLGVADTVRGKITRASPPEVVSKIVQGKGNDIGVMVMTLIIADKRLKLIGALPPDFQSYLIYAAAPMTSSQSPGISEDFIKFLASPRSVQEFVATGAN